MTKYSQHITKPFHFVDKGCHIYIKYRYGLTYFYNVLIITEEKIWMMFLGHRYPFIVRYIHTVYVRMGAKNIQYINGPHPPRSLQCVKCTV